MSKYLKISSMAIKAMPFVGSFLRRRMVMYWLERKQIRSILCRSDEDERTLHDALMSKEFRSFDEVLDRLSVYQWEKIAGSIDSNRKTVAFYLPSCAYRSNVASLIHRLRAKGYNVVVVVSEVCHDKVEKSEERVLYGGDRVMARMNYVDVTIIPTLTLDLPKNTKSVLFVHDIYDSPLGDEVHFLRHLLMVDYVFLPSGFVVDVFMKLLGDPDSPEGKKLIEQKSGEVCLIRGGYMKLDVNMEYFKDHGKDEKTIIYAPTVTGLDFEDIVSLPEYGEEIVAALLNDFPDYEIIFRPHPHSVHTKSVKKIVGRFRDNPRFTFDDNAGFYMGNYSRSAVMITDASGTAYTYAFTTLRPVIFFSCNEAAIRDRYAELRYFKDRGKIGHVCETIEEMVGEVGKALREKDFFSSGIREYRDSMIYNIGTAEDYFVENFDYIVEGAKHPDWICI